MKNFNCSSAVPMHRERNVGNTQVLKVLEDGRKIGGKEFSEGDFGGDGDSHIGSTPEGEVGSATMHRS